MKHDLPSWVTIYKEKGKTVKIKNGKYYLYEEKCFYDKKRKHKHITKNYYLGRITQDKGFIPTKSSRLVEPETYTSKIYGNYALIKKYCSDILDRLKEMFGENANLIFSIASLRAIEKTPYCELEDAYNENFFSIFDKTLAMSKTSLSDFLHDFSKNKDKFKMFMRQDIANDDTLIFDGTNLLCGSQNISYSGNGYKHGHNYQAQVNPLYAYSGTKRKLVYYKLFEGSVTDATSLPDLIKEANIKNGIGIMDSGFNSDTNIQSLLASKNQYIVALRRDSKYATDEILKDYNRKNAKEKFTNNKEAIFAYETLDETNSRICIYFNQTIASVDTTEYLDKMSKGWKEYTEENFDKAKERFGIYIIKTNITDMSLKKIYEYYKSRFEIEYSFDTLKNTLNFDKVFMHSDKSLESWMFINHISILITQKIYDVIKEKELNLSLHSLFKKMKQVVKMRCILDKTEDFIMQVIPAKTRKICEKLEIIS
jgi:transposase